jgi:hypothetical protein
LAETTGLEPARENLDGLANRYGYRFITFPFVKLSWATKVEMTFCVSELNLPERQIAGIEPTTF